MKRKSLISLMSLVFVAMLFLLVALTSKLSIKADSNDVYWSFDFEGEAPDQYFTDSSYGYAEGENIIYGSKSLQLHGGCNINTSNKLTIPASTNIYVAFDIKFVGGGADYIGSDGPVLIAYTNQGDATLGYVRVNMTASGVSLWAPDVDASSSLLNENGVSHIVMKVQSAAEGYFTYFKLLDVNHGDVVIDNFTITSYVVDTRYWAFDFEGEAPDQYFTDSSYGYAEGKNIIDGSKSLQLHGGCNINTSNKLTIPASTDMYVSFDIKFVGGGADYIGSDGPVLIAYTNQGDATLKYVRVNMTASGTSLWADGGDTTGSIMGAGVAHVSLKFTSAAEGYFTYFKLLDVNHGDIVIDNFMITSYIVNGALPKADEPETPEEPQDTPQKYFDFDFESETPDAYFKGSISYAEGDNIIDGSKSLQCGRVDFNNGNVVALPAGQKIYFSFDFKYLPQATTEQMVWICKNMTTHSSIGYIRFNLNNGSLSLACGEGLENVDSHVVADGVSHIVFSVTTPSGSAETDYLYIEMCDNNTPFVIDNMVIADYPVPYVAPATLADMTSILATIETAKAVNKSYYTEATVAVLEAKLTAAVEISTNATATQTEVDAAEAELIAAISGLAVTEAKYFEEDFSANAFGQYFNGSASIVRGEIGEGRSMKVSEAFATKGNVSILPGLETYFAFDYKFIGTSARLVIYAKDTTTDENVATIILTLADGVVNAEAEIGTIVSNENGRLVFKFVSAANNTYFKFVDISNYELIVDNFTVSNYAYTFTPTEDAIKEQVVVFYDDFENETYVVRDNGERNGSLPYSFDHNYFGLVDDEEVVISGSKSLALYHDHFITSPYALLKKGTKTYVSFKFRPDADVTMLQVLVRNFQGSHNDQSCGYIRLFFNNLNLTGLEENEGASFVLTPSVDENGVWTVYFMVTTKDYDDAVSSYVHITVDGTSATENRAGWGYFDEILITQDKGEEETPVQLSTLEGKPSDLLTNISQDPTMDVTENSIKFTFGGNVLNQADIAVFETKYNMLPGTYEIKFDLELYGLGRILMGVYDPSYNKIATLLYAPYSGATLYDYTENIAGVVVKENGVYHVTIRFTSDTQASLKVYVYQDTLTRTESNPAWLKVSNLVIKTSADLEATGLYQLISEAGKVSADNYTAASYSALNQAITKARDVLAGTDLTMTIAQAKTALETALNNLQELGDNTELKRLIANAKNIAQGNYTDESFAALQSAISAADEVKANTQATQDEIDSAKAALQRAIDALVEKETPPTTQAPTTQAPAKTDINPNEGGKKKGCKSVLGVAIVSLALVLSTAVFVIKRKKEVE